MAFTPDQTNQLRIIQWILPWRSFLHSLKGYFSAWRRRAPKMRSRYGNKTNAFPTFSAKAILLSGLVLSKIKAHHMVLPFRSPFRLLGNGTLVIAKDTTGWSSPAKWVRGSPPLS
jgi:hypothetical protein